MLVLRPGTSLILSAMGFGRQLDKSNSVTVKVTVAIFGGRRRRGVVNGLCTCCGLVQNLPVPSFFLVVSNACVCQDEKKRVFFFSVQTVCGSFPQVCFTQAAESCGQT